MEQCLVALEVRPDDAELLGELFRAAHTLKGNSATLGFTAMTEITHVLEDVLDRVRRKDAQLTRGLRHAAARGRGPAAHDGQAGSRPGTTARRRGRARCIEALRRAAAGESDGVALESRPVATAARGEAPAGRGSGPARARGLRVGLDKLDRLLRLAGEIAIARSRIGEPARGGRRRRPPGARSPSRRRAARPGSPGAGDADAHGAAGPQLPPARADRPRRGPRPRQAGPPGHRG